MNVYFQAQIRIKDETEYQKYLDRCDKIFDKYNGKYLAVDSSPEVLEGSWDYTRSVLIEFPDRDSFYKWYNSDEYQEILKHRLTGAACDSVLIEGK